MKNKKGSHVGMILSFVIFVTFAVFIAIIIQPTISVNSNKKTILSHLKDSINQEVVSELTTATVVINNNPTTSCVILEGFLSNYGMKPPFVVARSELGKNNAYSSADGNSLWINRNSGSDTFFKIYYSSEFPEISIGGGSCTTLTEGTGYSMGLVKTEEQIFESKIIQLINEYGEFGSTEYQSLKEALGVSSESEFSITFTDEEGTMVEADGEEPSVSIYTDESVIQYVSSDANIETGMLKISVW